METILALTACLFLIALGDIISIMSRAKIPAMAAIILLYLLATSLGMPKNYPELSGLATLGNILFPFFVAAVTTNILPKDLIEHWKFILIGCIASGFSMLLTVFVGGLFLGIPTAFSGAIVTCGGAFTAGMLVIEHLNNVGLGELTALPLLLTMTIDAVGQPIGSLLTKRYIIHLQKNWHQCLLSSATSVQNEKFNRNGIPLNSPENPSPWFTSWIPPQYETNSVALLQLAIVVYLSYLLGDLTGLGWAFMLVILGLTGSTLGFFRLNMMKRTASSGLIMSAIFTMVFQMLGDLSWSLITKQLVPLLVIILLSILGLVIGGAVGAKIMRCEPMLGIVASIGLFYFFPGVQNIITEVARTNIEDSDHYSFIFQHISTPSIITTFIGSRFCLLLAAVFIPIVFPA